MIKCAILGSPVEKGHLSQGGHGAFLFFCDEEMASRTGLFLALFKGNDGERRLLKFLFADFCRVSLRSNILQVPYTSGIF